MMFSRPYSEAGHSIGPAPDGMIWFSGGECSMGTADPPEINRVGMQQPGMSRLSSTRLAPRRPAG